MNTVIPRSVYLAVLNAKTSIALDAPIEAAEAQRVLDACHYLHQMVQARAAHIGLVNSVLQNLISSEQLDALEPETQQALMSLLMAGIGYATDDSGFSTLW